MAERAPPKRPETETEATEISPEAFAALIARVDALEDELEKTRRTCTDMVAKVNRLEDRIDGGDDQ